MFLLKRVLIVLLIIMGYFMILRPLRVQINTWLLSRLEVNPPYMTETVPTGIYVLQEGWEDPQKKEMKIPFGMFFLFGLLALVIISANKQEYRLFLALHMGTWCMAFFFFLLGSFGLVWVFNLMDLFIVYLLPMVTLGFVPFLYLKQRNHDTVGHERNTDTAGSTTP